MAAAGHERRRHGVQQQTALGRLEPFNRAALRTGFGGCELFGNATDRDRVFSATARSAFSSSGNELKILGRERVEERLVRRRRGGQGMLIGFLAR